MHRNFSDYAQLCHSVFALFFYSCLKNKKGTFLKIKMLIFQLFIKNFPREVPRPPPIRRYSAPMPSHTFLLVGLNRPCLIYLGWKSMVVYANLIIIIIFIIIIIIFKTVFSIRNRSLKSIMGKVKLRLTNMHKK